MRAISGGVGVEEAGVQALAAGVDALCVGHDLHEETVDGLVAGISDAARSGRLPLERLEKAAGWVAATAKWAAAADPTGAPGREVGGEAARRALRIHGSPTLECDPLVVELVPQAKSPRGSSRTPSPISGREPSASASTETPVIPLALPANDRPLVIVARDALRTTGSKRSSGSY